MAKRRVSLQDIIKKRQQQVFVGRGEQTELFRRNLMLPWEDDERHFIFNIYGQGGVGKSTLLRQFQQIAREVGASTAITDETEQDIVAVLARFAKQFEQQGQTLHRFADKYRQYYQQNQQLESEYKARLGGNLASRSRKTLHAVIAERFNQEELHTLCHELGIDYENLPGETKVAKAREMVGYSERYGRMPELLEACQKARPGFDWNYDPDMDTFAGPSPEEKWEAFVASRLNDVEAAQLTLQSVSLLTPLFVQDLADAALNRDIVLFCDTYERTAVFLDKWWRDVIAGEQYGDMPGNIALVFAGRYPLDADSWSWYAPLIAHLPLEPFTEAEARQYLAEKQITDEKVVEVILRISGRLPLLVATLAAGRPQDAVMLEEPSDLAVARFLRWIEDPQQRQLAREAALPRRLNGEILSIIAENGSAHYPWLTSLPFVQERIDGWAYYHEVVRSQMLRQNQRESLSRWREVHQLLASFYEERAATHLQADIPEWAQWLDAEWQMEILEHLYHRLAAAPRVGESWILQGFLKALQADSAFARRWARTVQQAQADSEIHITGDALGDRLVSTIRAFDESRYEDVLPMFQELLGRSDLDATDHVIALTWIGRTCRRLERFEDSLTALDKAIALAPDNFWAHHHRGWTYLRMGSYDQALACFDHVLQLVPHHQSALNIRGWLKQEMGDLDGALDDLNRVLAKDPEKASAYYHRGTTFLKLGQYKNALEDLNQAIRFKRKYWEAFVIRGDVFLLMKQFNEALGDFNRAIELKKDWAWTYAKRGITYGHLGKEDEAIDDLLHARDLGMDVGELELLMFKAGVFDHLRTRHPMTTDYIERRAKSD
jgi:tetratricopeptide (TPR) repeat protein